MHYIKRRKVAKEFERWRRAGNRQVKIPGAEITHSPFNVISFLDNKGYLIDISVAKTDGEQALHLMYELETGENKCGSNLHKYRHLVKRILAKWHER